MDKASAYEAGDCGFESRRGLFDFFFSAEHTQNHTTHPQRQRANAHAAAPLVFSFGSVRHRPSCSALSPLHTRLGSVPGHSDSRSHSPRPDAVCSRTPARRFSCSTFPEQQFLLGAVLFLFDLHLPCMRSRSRPKVSGDRKPMRLPYTTNGFVSFCFHMGSRERTHCIHPGRVRSTAP